MEQNEAYVIYNKDEEESIIERTPNRKKEAYFATMFEVIRHERSLVLLLSSTDPDIIKQSNLRMMR